MNIIGISAHFHDASCCLSRVKHDPRLPSQAFRYCLEMTPKWQGHAWTVPAAETRAGLNKVEIAWPYPRVDYALECEREAVRWNE